MPSSIENREGFFEMSMNHISDSAISNTDHNDNKNNNMEASSSSSESDNEIKKDFRDYIPPNLIGMPITPVDTCNSTPVTEKPVKTRTERILDSVHKRAPPRVIRRILKCSIAFFISTLFSTIYPVAIALGTAPYITCTGCLFCHPGRTMGAQIDATFTAALGAAFAIVYGLAGVSAATAYNASHPDSYAGAGINCMFLVIGVFGAQLIRQKFTKLAFFGLQFIIVQLFTLTVGVGYKEIPFSLSSDLGLGLIIGNFVSLFVNLILWPETAVDSLGRTLSDTLLDTQNMLNTITKQFVLDPKSKPAPTAALNGLAGKLRQDLLKLNTAYEEAKYEVSYAYSCSADLNPIRISLNRVTKHLNILGESLKSEQALFKDADFFSSKKDDSTAPSDGIKKDSSNNNPSSNQQKYGPHSKNENLQHSVLEATIRYMKEGIYTKPNQSPISEENDETQNNSSSITINDEINADFVNQVRSRRASSTSSLSIHSLHNTTSVAQTSSKSSNSRHEKEEGYQEENQKSYSSFSNILQSTGLSTPKLNPPQRTEKKISYDERHLLEIYLETLRDPLISLSSKCSIVLDCVRDSLRDQLDLPNDDDTGIVHKSFWRYLLHILKIKTISNEEHLNYLNKKKRNATFVCSCAESMQLRIAQFDKCEKERMEMLYKINQYRMKGKKLDLQIREELFLIFSFIFSLREVAVDLGQMAQQIKDLQVKTQAEAKANNQKTKKKKIYMPQITIQKWRKWFHSSSYRNVQDRGGYTFSYLKNHMPKETNERNLEDEYRLTQLLTNRTNNNLNEGSSKPYQESNSTPLRRREKLAHTTTLDEDGGELIELKSTQSIPDQITIGKPPLLLRLRYKLWLGLRYLQGYEFKFLLKSSLAVGILTVPAYIPGHYEWFNAARGQWAALTLILVMSPTSGGTLLSGIWRIGGTLLGAFIAWAVLEISETNGYLLSGCAFIIAVPSFYALFATSYSKVTIIVLINYMVIALGQYVTPTYYESASEKVWQRTATLFIGLAMALLLNWVIWPFIARDAVRTTLASSIGELGEYYSYVMGTFLYHNERLPPTLGDFKKAEKTEQQLGKMLNTCDELLKLTDHEPRLKGPFPKEYYKEISISAHNLLDRMINLRIALMKMSPEVKNAVCDMDKYLYRRDMVASILLHFYTVSSSLKAKIPLPPYMPSARSARLRLLKHRNQEDRPEKLLRYSNLTWFAMARATEEIISELEHLTDLIKFIVGESKFTLMARSLERRKGLQEMITRTDERND